MQMLTTTIKREFFRRIVANDKRVEYRDITPYWTRRLARVTPPFLLSTHQRYDAPDSRSDRRRDAGMEELGSGSLRSCALGRFGR
jgi:hypothetical protein